MTQTPEQTTINQYALPIGTRLKHYVIEKLLGQGGFGLVYLARDESLACQVAIKEYLPEQLASRTQGNTVSPNTENTQAIFAQYRNNFIREAQQIAQLDHPAIVRVMQVFEANNTAYMVMPYYTGEPLKRFQKRTNKRWNEAELKALLEPLLNALELLHQKNILHRDIAPDNIFLKDNGQPILIDFGAARQIESEYTISQNLLYKHGYSPIEHYSLSGKTQAGAWTDIYSLAAVVYELATGKKVPPAPDRVSHDQMLSLKSCHPVGLSPNFIASIDFALAIKGKERPRSISEWRDCMNTGKLSSSNTETAPTRVNVKNIQRPLIILVSGMLIIGLAYGAFAGYQAWQQQSQSQTLPTIQQLGTVNQQETKKTESNQGQLKASDIARLRAMYAERENIVMRTGSDESYAENCFKHLTFWKHAAKQGQAIAQVLLGSCYEYGKSVPQDNAQALAWYHKAAEQGEAGAQYSLGFMYQEGKGVAQDDVQAVAWYRKAAEQGDASAQANLGFMYQEGKGVAQDDVQAVAWYRKAAEQGNAVTQANLGFMYQEGRGVAQDDTQAVAWYRKAAEQGNAVTQTNLGWMYEHGKGVAQDNIQAVAWYRKAAEQGESSGQNNLGFMYQEGKGVAQDDTQAVAWYRKAAEQGNAVTQTNLGWMYEHGKGVDQDNIQAVAWYRKAAEQGETSGQNNLGFMYQEGKGVAQDDVQAVTWYRKAAEQGDASGQHNLAFMYQEGRGVAQDDAQAVAWYRKAAEQGNADAKVALANMGLK